MLLVWAVSWNCEMYSCIDNIYATDELQMSLSTRCVLYSEESINMLTWLLLAEALWNLWIEFPWGNEYFMDWDFPI